MIRRNIYLILFLLFVFLLLYFANPTWRTRITNIKDNEPKYVFIDLGAHNGDSIKNFLGYSSSSLGGSLSGIRQKSAKWIVYAVEANEDFDKSLEELETIINSKEKGNVDLRLFKQTAAWTEDGFIDFFIPSKYSLTSSVNKVNEKNVRKNKVKSIDVARIIKQFDQKDFVFIKMDIETTEFILLKDFLVKNVAHLIDHLAVEYHGNGAFMYPDTKSVFNSIYQAVGVELHQWS